jgi:hypothetical protein
VESKRVDSIEGENRIVLTRVWEGREGVGIERGQITGTNLQIDRRNKYCSSYKKMSMVNKNF